MALANYGQKFSDVISGLRRRQLLTGQPFASKDITNIAEPYFASARDSAATESALGLENQALDLEKQGLGLEKQGLKQKASQFSQSLSETQRQNASALALEREKIRLGEDEADKNRRLQLASTGIQGLGVGTLGYNIFGGGTPATVINEGALASEAGAKAAAAASGGAAPTAVATETGVPWWSGKNPISGLSPAQMAAYYAGGSLVRPLTSGTKEFPKEAATGLSTGLKYSALLGPEVGLPIGALEAAGQALGIKEAEKIEEPLNFMESAVSKGIEKITSSCIIVTACTHRDSYEVGITREYRDRFLDAETLRGYYMLAEKVVPVMKKHGWTKRIIKRFLVDPLISYGEHALDYTDIRPSAYAVMVKVFFLTLCRKVGEKRAQFVRANGEIF